jgi:hypothetical protein
LSLDLARKMNSVQLYLLPKQACSSKEIRYE